MRILVYGFGPYRQYRDNITARIIRALPKQPGVTKIVLPVRFQRRQFVNLLNRHKPEIILGLGQSSRRRIDLERRAKNRRRARETATPKPIFERRPRFLSTTLFTQRIRSVGQSDDAGDYVCNYSMYVLLDEINRKDSKTRLGFMHIPHDYADGKALTIVQEIIDRCRPVE